MEQLQILLPPSRTFTSSPVELKTVCGIRMVAEESVFLASSSLHSVNNNKNENKLNFQTFKNPQRVCACLKY